MSPTLKLIKMMLNQKWQVAKAFSMRALDFNQQER